MIDDGDDFEDIYFTRDQVLTTAREEACRSIEETFELVRYVYLDRHLRDYCLCAFTLRPGGYVRQDRALLRSERLPGEEVRDELIREFARSGQMVAAVRLYRIKHDASLQEAKVGVESLLAVKAN